MLAGWSNGWIRSPAKPSRWKIDASSPRSVRSPPPLNIPAQAGMGRPSSRSRTITWAARNAARRRAVDADLVRGVVLEHHAVDGDDVVDGRRIGVLGGQAVVHRQDRRAGQRRDRDRLAQRARADDEAAGVEVDQDVVRRLDGCVGRARGDPMTAHSADAHLADGDRVELRGPCVDGLHRRVDLGAPIGQAGSGGRPLRRVDERLARLQTDRRRHGDRALIQPHGAVILEAIPHHPSSSFDHYYTARIV